jgi:ubiquinone/menaquinone biosynthesis C-methylase UbiE
MKKDPYERVAARYDRMIEPSASRLRARGLEICPPRENQRILDMACGTGTQLTLYARPGCELAGVDLSPAMLETARRKLGDTVDLRLGSATETGFAGASFDLVTVVLALHEMAPEVRLLVMRECRRVVKPGGRILLIDFHYGPYPFPRGWLYKAFILWMEVGAGRTHFAHYRDFMARRGLDALVADQGFSVTHRFVVDGGFAAIFLLQG